MHTLTIAGLSIARWGHGNLTVTGWGWLAGAWACLCLAGFARSIISTIRGDE